jgi:DNA-directed RNA polymerase specialized sigma24 family protein
MNVRIDNDFWANYEEHEVLLRKCFTHLYFKKYPVAEGKESAYNFVVMELFRKGIFNRFDAKREGIKVQTTIVGKTTTKKFEQFLYKWTESIMYGLYHNARKYSERYLKFPSDKIEGLNEISYSSFKEAHGVSNWLEESEERVEFVNRKFRNIDDSEDYHAETPLDASESCEESELYGYLESVLKNDRERMLIECKKDGLNNSDAGRVLNVSPSQIKNILNSIRSRCSAVLSD